MLVVGRTGFVGDSISVYQVAWGQQCKSTRSWQESGVGTLTLRWFFPTLRRSKPALDAAAELLEEALSCKQRQIQAWGLKSFLRKKECTQALALQPSSRRKSCTCIDSTQRVQQCGGGGIHPRLFQLHRRFQSDRSATWKNILVPQPSKRTVPKGDIFWIS